MFNSARLWSQKFKLQLSMSSIGSSLFYPNLVNISRLWGQSELGFFFKSRCHQLSEFSLTTKPWYVNSIRIHNQNARLLNEYGNKQLRQNKLGHVGMKKLLGVFKTLNHFLPSLESHFKSAINNCIVRQERKQHFAKMKSSI